MRYRFVLLILFSIAALPAHAAGLNRCIGADNTTIFTDQSCADLGAIVRPGSAPTTSVAAPGRLRAHGCARTSDDLLEGLRTAFEAGDVNQVAAFYHWPGITNAGAESILKRLKVLAGRPLISAELIRQHPPQDADGFPTVASGRQSEARGIELIQERSGADGAPMRTVFALTQYMGCRWVRF